MRNWIETTSIPHNAKVFRILKCIHQEFIAVPVLELRNSLYEKYPYKDIAKSWKVEVHIDHRNGVTVRHKKKEQCHNQEPDMHFSFEWRLDISFNKSMTNFDAEVYIYDWWFSDQINPKRKIDVETTFLPFVKIHSLYRRSIENVNPSTIYDQLISLSRTIEITDANKAPLYFPPSSKDEDCAWEIILILAKNIGNDEVKSKMEQFINSISSLPIKKRINEIIEKGIDSHKSMLILKALNPQVRSIAYDQIYSYLSKVCPKLMDDKKEWRAKIQISSSTVSLKLESIAYVRESDQLSIKWEIDFKFNKDLSNFTTDLKIIDWEFIKIDLEKQNQIRRVMDPLIRQTAYYTKQLSKEFNEYKIFDKIVQAAQKTVISYEDQVIYRDSNNSNSAYHFLLCLASQLDNDYIIDLIKSKSLKITCSDVNERNENIKALLSKKTLQSSVMSKVLRCIDVYILTPAILKLRNVIYEKLPYVTKTTHISEIEIKKKRITIINERTEKAHTNDPANYFEFTWRLTLTFTKDMENILKSEIHIVDWNFSHQSGSEIRSKFELLAAPFIPEWAPYRRCWKNTSSLLGQDLITCAGMIKIDDNNNPIYIPDKMKEKIDQVKEFFLVIFEKVDPIKSNKLMSLLTKSLESKSDLGSGVDSFLSNEFLTESDSFKVLNMLSQQILNPAIMKLRKDYFIFYPYKSIKGSWRCILSFSNHNVIVKHSKEERSSDAEKLESYFSFKWQLTLKINLNRDRLKSNLQIKYVKFHEKTSQEVRAGVQSLFGNIIRDTKSAYTNSIEIISASELIGYIASTLERATNLPNIDHPSLSKYDIPSLLRSIEKTISGIQIPPISLSTPTKRRSTDFKESSFETKPTSTISKLRSASLTVPSKGDFFNEPIKPLASNSILPIPSPKTNFERTIRKSNSPSIMTIAEENE